MTLGFAVFEFAQGRYFSRVKWPETWSTRDLPALNRQKGPSFANRVADFVMNGLMYLWVLAVPTHPYLILGPGGSLHGMPFGLSPEWRIFYWQIVGLLGVMLALKFCLIFARSVNWIKGLGLVTQVASLLILVVMVQARTYFVYVPKGHWLPSLEDAGVGELLGELRVQGCAGDCGHQTGGGFVADVREFAGRAGRVCAGALGRLQIRVGVFENGGGGFECFLFGVVELEFDH